MDYDDQTEAKIMNLASFQKQLQTLSASGDVGSTIALIDEGLERGMRAADLLLGSVSAVLSGDNSVQLKEFYERVVEAARAKYTQLESGNLSADVLLIHLASNPHKLGAQLLELWLNAEGISSLALVKTSQAEVLAAAEQIVPKVVGFSISSKDQLPEIRSLAQQLKIQCEPNPLFLLGGYLVKTGQIAAEDAPELALVEDESKLFLILKTHLAMSFFYGKKRKAQ